MAHAGGGGVAYRWGCTLRGIRTEGGNTEGIEEYIRKKEMGRVHQRFKGHLVTAGNPGRCGKVATHLYMNIQM